MYSNYRSQRSKCSDPEYGPTSKDDILVFKAVLLITVDPGAVSRRLLSIVPVAEQPMVIDEVKTTVGFTDKDVIIELNAVFLESS